MHTARPTLTSLCPDSDLAFVYRYGLSRMLNYLSSFPSWYIFPLSSTSIAASLYWILIFILNLVFLSLSKYYITLRGIVIYAKKAEKNKKIKKNFVSSVSVSLAELLTSIVELVDVLRQLRQTDESGLIGSQFGHTRPPSAREVTHSQATPDRRQRA